jgi:hypothetical protein
MRERALFPMVKAVRPLGVSVYEYGSGYSFADCSDLETHGAVELAYKEKA